MMSPITCHILDSSTGRPVPDVQISLQVFKPRATDEDPDIFEPLAKGVTNSDGRCLDLLPPLPTLEQTHGLYKPGMYKIIFKVRDYFEGQGKKCFYPWVEITFEVDNINEHYHIPLLISPFSFTTYRGS